MCKPEAEGEPQTHEATGTEGFPYIFHILLLNKMPISGSLQLL